MKHELSSVHRVAIYAAPAPYTDAWERGSQWLGRCAMRRSALPMPTIPGVDPALQSAITADPRRYGWHATLKAPMRLASPSAKQALRGGLAAIGQRHRPIELPRLEVIRLGSFLALCPVSPPKALNALANDCVQCLQPWAAPLNEAELARRRRATLTPEEDALLLAWGYPWVLDRFRFHFSLTGSLKGVPDDTVKRLQAAASAHFQGLSSWRLTHLSIFVEPTPGADFELLEQVELLG